MGLICACIMRVLPGGLPAYSHGMDTMLDKINVKIQPPLN